MEVSQEISSMVRGWLMASPSARKRKQPPDYVPISPRPERLGLGAELCKGSNGLDTAQRREVAVRMERKIVGRRRKLLDTENTVAAPQMELAWMKKKQSQDLSSDEECSRTAAVKMGRKMKGTHLQKALLGGCEGIPRRRRRKKKRHEQVSETAVSEIVPPSNGSDKLLNCCGELDTKGHMFQQPHESSSPRVKKVERTPGGDTVVQEDLSAETNISKQEEKKTCKRKKMTESLLCSPKKHKASSWKTGQKDEQSSGPSDLEEASSSAAERAHHEQLTPSELDVLQPAPHCGLEQCNSKTASPPTAAQFVKESKKRRVKNAKNPRKTQTNISTCPNPASDGDNQLQTMKDIAMETSIMTQRRVNCSSRARRQLQRKAFLHQKRKLLKRKRRHCL